MPKKTKEKKPKNQRDFAVIDFETDPFLFGRVPRPFICGYYDKNGFQHFFDLTEFIEFIKEKDILIYAHNGGKFDFHFMLEGVEQTEKIMIINGRIAKLQFGNAELRDSYLLFPIPLSAYQKDEIDYSIFEEKERRKIENMAKIIEYLKGDCKYLYDLLSIQFELYGQKLTLASSAFDFWHKKFNPYKYKPKTNAQFFNTFRPFYYGGRVECFKKGIINENFTVSDIRSAYPFAMQFEHPYGDEYEISDTLPENYETCFIEFLGISKGALPYRTPEKSLIFPSDGEIRQYKVTGWELKKGIELGLIEVKQIIQVITFENRIKFTDYVQYFYKEKELNRDNEGNSDKKAKYLLAKLYMNSLYGKFGQSSLDHRDYELIEPAFIESYMRQEYEFEGLLGSFALMSTPIEDVKQRFYNVATAASITGYVRAYLFEHIAKSEGVLYCDTDSIAATKFNGVIGDDLGQWEKEGDFVQAAIGGKKLYAFKRKVNKKDNQYKISSKGAKLTAEEIFSIAKGETVSYKNHAPTFSINKPPVFLERKIRST